MKRIAIFGSTGSIGRNTLKVISGLASDLEVFALSAHSNIDVLCQQVEKFRPRYVCVSDQGAYASLARRLRKTKTKVLFGEEGLEQIVSDSRVDEIVMAISGACALKPLLAALKNSKVVASANKEALVMAASVIAGLLKKFKGKIIPIDSEQSAIWQCISQESKAAVGRIYLTASGGPFRGLNKNQLAKISVRDALRHPRWKMGPKITVDSATLMNKGLEVLEAMALFDLGHGQIEIIVHPEAVIHSMVEFIDGIILAQLSVTDMRIPIQYALTYPLRYPNSLPRVDFIKLKSLTFEKPDFKKFPCLDLAYQAARKGETFPCVLNAANEVCVDAFLKNRLGFNGIPRVIEKVLRRHRSIKSAQLEDILQADSWARKEAANLLT